MTSIAFTARYGSTINDDTFYVIPVAKKFQHPSNYFLAMRKPT